MQYSLFKADLLDHGGKLRLGQAKTRRPLSLSQCHHIVLKAKQHVHSFLPSSRRENIHHHILRWSNRFQIQVYARSVNSNHIHLLIRSNGRTELQNFLRVLPGQIAQSLQREPGKFWDSLTYTRVVHWGRDYERVMKYIELNTLEAAGLVQYWR